MIGPIALVLAALVAPAPLLADLEQRQNMPTSFEATYVLEEWKGAESARTVYAMRHAPAGSRLEVTESTSLPKGLVVTNRNTGKVRIRLPGPASFVSFEVDARAPQSKGLLGLYPADVAPDAFMDAMFDRRNTRRYEGTTTLDGRELHQFAVTGPATIAPGATLRAGFTLKRPFPYMMELTTREGHRMRQRFPVLRERAYTESSLFD